MFLDANQIETGKRIETDLCIIGAGAAGLSMARELAHTPLRVCLLESGGLKPEARVQELYQAESTGLPYFLPLDGCRQRFFGGSTNCWAGWCRPLDPVDFDARDEVPHSGWPFDHEHLATFYARASEHLAIANPSYDAESWREPGADPLPMDPARFVNEVFQLLMPPPRLGVLYRERVEEVPNLTTILHATVMEIVADREGRRVDHLEVTSLDGARFRVAPRVTVLATGGIENPRLLLLSNRVHPNGIGNDHDLVGRFFMEHIHLYRFGTVYVTPPRNDYGQFYRRRKVEQHIQALGTLALAEAELRRRRMPNAALTLEPLLPREVHALAERDEVYRDVAQALPLPWERARLGPQGYIARLTARIEQVPNPESRIRLSETRDALGQRKACLHWSLTDLDYETGEEAIRLLSREFGYMDAGRIQLDPRFYDRDAWPLSGGPHHMGTTRMHDDPRRGVVDANGKVHGLSNLYVAGSSVFPTGGFANPTLTIVALALRLADHLKQEAA